MCAGIYIIDADASLQCREVAAFEAVVVTEET